MCRMMQEREFPLSPGRTCEDAQVGWATDRGLSWVYINRSNEGLLGKFSEEAGWTVLSSYQTEESELVSGTV